VSSLHLILQLSNIVAKMPANDNCSLMICNIFANDNDPLMMMMLETLCDLSAGLHPGSDHQAHRHHLLSKTAQGSPQKRQGLQR
jgi:hypothetical protein